MRLWTTLLGIIAVSVGSASPALAQRFPFERSFDVSGPSALDISTIRGKIDVTTGEPGKIVVVGTATVRVGMVPGNAEDLARKVAANPPIQREGQTLKLLSPSDGDTLRAVTVSYEVRVPPDTDVTTVSESGATSVRGVSRAVTIRTQSGAIDVMQLTGATSITSGSASINARSMAGDVRVRTSSGSVEVTFSGEGNADVETGSSVIRVSGIRGGVVATTRSGHVSLEGEPRRNWTVAAGSGSVDANIGTTPFTLDASGGGSVKVTGATVQGSITKRKVTGSIAGGGPVVKLTSRSGSVVVRTQG